MKVVNGDCLDELKALLDNSIDSVVTDPPYGIAFMGKKWDHDVPSVEVWKECLRVLKPGGHMLVACGTRTQHRMVVNVEDAGFEIRDVITWHYGSGFPKSMDVSKAIDKAAGAEREVIGPKKDSDGRCRAIEPKADDMFITNGLTMHASTTKPSGNMETAPATDSAKKWQGWGTALKPATDSAKKWQGWGTALKPATEFWTLARKPISEKTVAANVLKWGTGAINIDGCRIEGEPTSGSGANVSNKVYGEYKDIQVGKPNEINTAGRWPANLILDEEAGAMLDEQSGILKSGAFKEGQQSKESENACMSGKNYAREHAAREATQGGASRFFYCAKASKSERGEGNTHPTVKPKKLMSYLCKLITPPKGIVLDPFMGSGSTGVAALAEGFDFVGFEKDAAYFEIASKRLGT